MNNGGTHVVVTLCRSLRMLMFVFVIMGDMGIAVGVAVVMAAAA